MKRHPPRRRFQVLLPADLADRLVKTCTASTPRVSLTMFIADAIRDRLDGTVDKAQLLRRLDQHDAAQDQTRQGVELVQDALANFLRVWFAHTPPLLAAEKPAARAQAEGRYKQFVEHLAGQSEEGRHFIDDFRDATPRPGKRPAPKASDPESSK